MAMAAMHIAKTIHAYWFSSPDWDGDANEAGTILEMKDQDRIGYGEYVGNLDTSSN